MNSRGAVHVAGVLILERLALGRKSMRHGSAQIMSY